MSRWDHIWNHLRDMYAKTTDRELTVAAAEWYEKNESWALAGLALKVERAIERKER